ncbi:MAG: type 4a pilus biogenesis protein PilO [Terriglobales bacterium]
MRASRPLRRKLSIATAILLAADAVLVAFLLSPWGPSRSPAEAALARAEGRYVTLRRQVTGLESLRQEIATSRRQAHQLLSVGMPAERTADFQILSSLQDMAQKAGVQANTFAFHPSHDSKLGLRRVDVSMRVTGRYGSLIGFINRVERAPMFLIIRQVSLSARGPGAEGGSAALAIQIASYVRAAKTAPSAGGGA